MPETDNGPSGPQALTKAGSVAESELGSGVPIGSWAIYLWYEARVAGQEVITAGPRGSDPALPR